MSPYAAGALAGVVATVPMTLAMEAWYRRLPRRQHYPLPPYGITSNLARGLGLEARLRPDQLRRLTLVLHFGFGALAGAAYPMLGRIERLTLSKGMVYGVGVWAASYLGWVPATGLLAPATRQPLPRVRLMIGVHLVWGAALALVLKSLASAGNERLGSFGQPIVDRDGSDGRLALPPGSRLVAATVQSVPDPAGLVPPAR